MLLHTFLSVGSRAPFRWRGLEGEGVGDAGEAPPVQWEPGVGDPASDSMCRLQEEGEADTQGLSSARREDKI